MAATWLKANASLESRHKDLTPYKGVLLEEMPLPGARCIGAGLDLSYVWELSMPGRKLQLDS